MFLHTYTQIKSRNKKKNEEKKFHCKNKSTTLD